MARSQRRWSGDRGRPKPGALISPRVQYRRASSAVWTATAPSRGQGDKRWCASLSFPRGTDEGKRRKGSRSHAAAVLLQKRVAEQSQRGRVQVFLQSRCSLRLQRQREATARRTTRVASHPHSNACRPRRAPLCSARAEYPIPKALQGISEVAPGVSVLSDVPTSSLLRFPRRTFRYGRVGREALRLASSYQTGLSK